MNAQFLRLVIYSTLSFLSLQIHAQDKTFSIAGKVIDVKSGQPLAGASVFCQNTTIGTISKDDGAFSMRLNNGGYVQLTTMLTSFLGVLVRGDLRDAFVWLGDPTLAEGAERLYITKSWRVTGGVRVVVSQRIVGKIEYLHNGEYGGVPSIPNDVFTSSVVMSY